MKPLSEKNGSPKNAVVLSDEIIMKYESPELAFYD